jgi:tetratricopeptide (TPR) repeat protein
MHYRTYLDAAPSDLSTHAEFAGFLVSFDNLPLAKTHFDIALSLDPSQAVLWAERGFVYYITHDYDQAVSSFANATGLGHNDYHIHTLLGHSYLGLKNYSDALSSYVMAIEADSNKLEAQVGQAEALQGLGYHTDSIKQCDSILEANPDCARAHLARANSRHVEGLLFAAMKDYSEALAAEKYDSCPLAPDTRSMKSQHGMIYLRRAMALSELGAHEEALDDHETGSRLLNGHPYFEFTRVALLINAGKKDEALALSREMGRDKAGILSEETVLKSDYVFLGMPKYPSSDHLGLNRYDFYDAPVFSTPIVPEEGGW